MLSLLMRMLACAVVFSACAPLVHPSDGCQISGVAVARGAANPEDSCQVCDPRADAELWTDRAAGFPCASDGLCDGAGGCRHDSVTARDPAPADFTITPSAD